MTRHRTQRWAAALAGLATLWLAGCEAPFARLDRRTTELLAATNLQLGADTIEPRLGWEPGSEPDKYSNEFLYAEHPPTTNPPASTLTYQPAGTLTYPPAGDADDVLRRLDAYAEPPTDAIDLDLNATLVFAVRHSREYRFAEEDYVLEALRLMSERHLWGPRVFNDTEIAIDSFGDDGLFDTSLRLVNDLRVTQRLPYGGTVSAQFLAALTEDLHQRVAEENPQTADLIFAAEVPLLRGAGMVARESLIQAERNVVYAARAFERFRRVFLLDITRDFLDLVAAQQTTRNLETNIELLEQFEVRAVALTEAGRRPPVEAAQAAQDTLSRRDTLNSQRESYRLRLDRLKVRIGMPDEQAVRIVASGPGLPPPRVNLDEAVESAMRYRLDLQNRRDFVDDARRGINVARNALLADLDLSGSVSIPTDDDQDYPGLDFDLGSTTFRAALVLGLPTDRTLERVILRQTQIDLERTIREYSRFRDTVAVNVRNAVRSIDTALFSRDLQQESLRVAEVRLASIEAAPDRVDSLQRSDTANGLLQAQERYVNARQDLQLAILDYLLQSGQLRIDPDGTTRPLKGMELRQDDPIDAAPGDARGPVTQ